MIVERDKSSNFFLFLFFFLWWTAITFCSCEVMDSSLYTLCFFLPVFLLFIVTLACFFRNISVIYDIFLLVPMLYLHCSSVKGIP